ncbi:MAG: hypothetical protein K6E91_04885 [Butyrivibrio sp.]|nr:hypothetical protein [Butyrivibrio sp.]
MSKYNKIMERVRVDEEMKSRILENLERECDKAPSKVRGASPLRRYIARYGAIAAVFAILFIGTYAVLHNGGIVKNHAGNELSAPEAESAQMPSMDNTAMEEEADRTEMTVAQDSAVEEEANGLAMQADDGYAMEQETAGMGMTASKESVPEQINENKANEQQTRRICFYIHDTENIEITPSKVTFIMVSIEDPSGIVDDGSMTLIADKRTVFAETCDMDSFTNYVKSQNPLDWFNGTGSGNLGDVFEVDITGNHIDTIYGIRPLE